MIKGKKRHILVDILGLLLHAIVHSAAIQDRAGGRTRPIPHTACVACGGGPASPALNAARPPATNARRSTGAAARVEVSAQHVQRRKNFWAGRRTNYAPGHKALSTCVSIPANTGFYAPRSMFPVDVNDHCRKQVEAISGSLASGSLGR
jgi:hypothetical protein